MPSPSLRAQLAAREFVAGAVEGGFPERRRACHCLVVTPRNVNVSTDITRIAANDRDAMATGLVRTNLTPVPSDGWARARGAQQTSDWPCGYLCQYLSKYLRIHRLRQVIMEPRLQGVVPVLRLSISRYGDQPCR